MDVGPFKVSGSYTGDCMALLPQVPTGTIQCVVTSPPYFGLRSYLPDDHPDKALEIGTEETPDEYVAKMVDVFREVRRALRDDGTCWLNLGDSYNITHQGAQGAQHSAKFHATGDAYTENVAVRRKRGLATGLGLKPKDLIGIPWRVAFALQSDGWYLRQDIVWHKPSTMPESVTDRCTKAHEYLFLLTKKSSYFYDSFAVAEPAVQAGRVRSDQFGGNKYKEGVKHSDGSTFTGSDTRNRRSVWSINPEPYNGAHFAVMPTELVKPCIMAGTSEHGACDQCGAPWERIIESQRTLDGEPVENLGSWKDENYAVGAQGVGHWRYGTERTEKGWRPTCKCEGAGVRPCVVFDPFFGSGTIGRVAEDLGRLWLGFDLNPEYAELQRQRTAQMGLSL